MCSRCCDSQARVRCPPSHRSREILYFFHWRRNKSHSETKPSWVGQLAAHGAEHTQHSAQSPGFGTSPRCRGEASPPRTSCRRRPPSRPSFPPQFPLPSNQVSRDNSKKSRQDIQSHGLWNVTQVLSTSITGQTRSTENPPKRCFLTGAKRERKVLGRLRPKWGKAQRPSQPEWGIAASKERILPQNCLLREHSRRF